MNLAATVHQSQVENEEGPPSIIGRSFLELSIEEQIERINSCTKLFGREEYQRCLFDAYNNSQDNSKVNIIIVKGGTGCGKTALVNSLREKLWQTNGTLLEWSCERHAMLQLYSGITDALLKWVDSIPLWGPQKINNWKERIRKSLDTTEILILIDRWPQLKPLFPVNNEMQHPNVGY